MKTDLKSLCLNLFLGVPLYRITAAAPTENHRQIMNMHRKSFFTSSIQISILTVTPSWALPENIPFLEVAANRTAGLIWIWKIEQSHPSLTF